VVGASEDGELITEPVELTSGEVIAEGAASSLGDGPVLDLTTDPPQLTSHENLA